MTDPWKAELVAFGGRLRKLRKANGLRLQDLADRIPSNTSTLSQLERGEGERGPDEKLVGRYVEECVAELGAALREATFADVLKEREELMDRRQFRGPSARRRATAERVVLQGAVLFEWPGEDAVVDFGGRRFEVSPVSGAMPELPVDQARAHPSRLLQPRFAVVPFTGRDDELGEAATWRGGTEPVAVQLLHAAGGQGKTRLADRIAADSLALGWQVWQVRHDPAAATQPEPAPNHVVLGSGTDLLVLVDYGDRWPTDDLMTFIRTMQQLARRRETHVRVLVLGRTARHWWPAVVGRLDADHHLDATGQWPLSPLVSSTDARRSMFRTAAAKFAERLDVPGGLSTLTEPVDLDRAEYGQVLAVQMAALAAVDAHLRGKTAPTDVLAVADYLLCREYAGWDELHGTRAGFTRAPVMSRIAYTATLVGSLPRPHARAALRRTELADSADGADRLIDDHLACYPASDPRAVFEPVHPDRLGEDLVALTTPGHEHVHLNWQPDDWTTAATGHETVLSAAAALTTADPPAEAPTWAPGVLAVLAESAHRYPHLSTEVINPLLTTDPGLLLVAGPAAATRLTELPGLDIAVLEAAEVLLPQARDVHLDVAAAAVARKLTEHRLATETDPARRADLHGNLAVRLNKAGQYAEGLAHADLAVTEARQGTDETLALWLNSQSLLLARAGRRKEALAGAKEAANIRRQRPQDVPGLANALNTLGTSLAATGDHKEALVHDEEAARLYRQLVAQERAEFVPDLAMVLHNIAASRSDLELDGPALEAADESVALYRALAEEDFAAYGPDLADALQNLPAYLHADPNREGDAVTVAEESVALYRRLVAINPAAFLPELAGGLHNLGVSCSQAGNVERALRELQESVTIYRELAEADPDAHQPDLALSLRSQATSLSAAGRREEALEAGTEAVTLFGQLASVDPRRFTGDLAMVFYNQASYLSELGRTDEAIKADEEAVASYRRLVDDEGLYTADLADAVHNLAFILGEAGRHDEALPLAEEAVERNVVLAAEDEDRVPFLAVARSTLGRELAERGRAGEAVRCAEAAVEALRLESERDDMWTPFLSGALTTWAIALDASGRRDAALTAVREAVAIVRAIEQKSPGSVTPHLLLADEVLARLTG
ncbi:tetratricopeptide repeat protein [Lentzea terrae]|uniref:tetratricopeptide repeat protein n=1 Tax=Lentzea terrae TaxID=2200761 RepID=UPI000DD44696|nr:tetratricopeptide repeat protein [Lentzea terrae]